MSVNEKMKAIASGIRFIEGLAGSLTLDDMAEELGKISEDIENAFTAVGNKGGTVPTYALSHKLASAIDTIPTGVTVQRKTGTLTTNSSGTATVNCGFKPDVVCFRPFSGGASLDGNNGEYEGQLNFVLSEMGNGKQGVWNFAVTVYGNQAYYILGLCTPSSNGFTFRTYSISSTSATPTPANNQRCDYIAIKYT